MHKARPTNIDCEKLSPHFAHQEKEIIRQTLMRTTQLAKQIIRSPLRRHIKSRFKCLAQPRLNEVTATDTHFSNTGSIEGHWCSQVFYGCSSRIIEVHDMTTESEFPSVCKDFIGERGFPHTLRRDNAQSDASSEMKDIH